MLPYSMPFDCTQPNDPDPLQPTSTGELCPTGIVIESFSASSPGDNSLAILIAFLLVFVIVFAIAKRKKMV